MAQMHSCDTVFDVVKEINKLFKVRDLHVGDDEDIWIISTREKVGYVIQIHSCTATEVST